jgi:TonB-dependent receptor
MKFKLSKSSAAVSLAMMPLLFATSFNVIANEDDKEKSSDTEVIVVSGIKASLIKAQEIKRSSDTVIESVTAEDLGKFSDENIGDALARVPGVQIERNDGGQSGDRISIRGMGPSFVATSVNGRTLLSSGNEGLNNMRSFNLDVLPSFLFTGATVKKMATASDVEIGLAGGVDMQTLKPLDRGLYKDTSNGEKDTSFVSVQLQGSQDSIMEDIGHNASILMGGKSEDGTLGYYVGYSKRQQNIGTDQIITDAPHYENLNIDDDSDGVADRVVEGVIVPFWQGNEPIRMDRGRETFSGAIQWKPSDDLQLIVDFTRAELDYKSYRNRGVEGYWTGIWGAVIDANSIQLNEDETVLQHADFSGFSDGIYPIAHQALALEYDAKTINNIMGANLSWQVNDDLKMIVDVSYSDIDYDQPLFYGLIGKTIPSNGNYYDVSGDYPINSFADDIENSTTPYAHQFNAVRYINMEGDDLALKVDFEHEFGQGIFEYFEYGARYNKVSILSRRSIDLSFPDVNTPRDDAAIVDAIFTGEFSNFNFLDGNDAFPSLDLQGYSDSYPEFKYAQSVCSDINQTTQVSDTEAYCIAQNPTSLADSTEESLAIYGQANLAGSMMDMDWAGNVGVRVVNVKNEGHGVINNVDTGAYENVTTKGDYTEILPSANFSLYLNDNVTWRLGVSKVVTRPEQSDLVPRISATFPDPTADPDALPRATAGNPDLKPYSAWLFDSTIELYTPNDGAVVFSFFYKDVKDFIGKEVVYDTVPGYEDEIFIVNKPLNISDADVVGFEVGFNQPFSFLPDLWSGLGLQANYTYVQSSFDESEKVGDFGYGMPGSSRNNANAILYYEKSGLGLRLSATYRDEYFANLNPQQAELSAGIFTESSIEFTLGANYYVNEYLSLNLNVQNMFKEDRRDFAVGNTDVFSAYFKRPRIITFGLTMKM